ncbi:MAG: peptidylprolyl isomerase [Flavobacteriaceae bacterium]|nr:peptidylprolyl isomerase [Flavobacteriaceae bacterium]
MKKTVLFLLLSITIHGLSQTEEVLFSIDDQAITTKEFTHVYNKNIDDVLNNNQKEIDNYLELYVNYKLKVRQAQDLKLDTVSSYKKDLSSYKKQLMAPYLRDDESLNELVKEAYDRSLVKINASHILIKLPKNSKDTLAAYTKIMEAKEKIEAGEDIATVAVEYSEDPSAAINEGNLGYFSVFNMVYPFENAVYSTKKNEVSNPFRSRFGYHIVYVHDIRKIYEPRKISSITIKLDSVSSRTKIDKLYQKLEDGEDFSDLVLKFSEDDSTSVKKRGDLGWFDSLDDFEKYRDLFSSLENIGDYSQPFKTEFGWSIIKLTDIRRVRDFEEVEEALTKKVKEGDRANTLDNSIIHEIKDNYTIVVKKKSLKLFKSGSQKVVKKLDKVFMTLEGETVSNQQFFDFLEGKEFSSALLEKFKEEKIMDYYKLHLVETNEEFAFLFQEYREGLLLFSLTQQRIWDKSTDSIGLKTYYESNKKNYKQSLEEDRGQILNDYQANLQDLWIEELHKTYNVKINNLAVEKLKGTINEE